tara:strand:- start:1695 stop:2147 length:453 start_codon:yes stop_codon:yes gene_type:complete
MHKIYDKTSSNIYQNHKDLIDSFMEYSFKRLNYSKPVTIYFVSDLENANNPLGKSAYYDHGKHVIVLFTDNRHFKDILRSLSHELIHHGQACRGEFDDNTETEEGYAQKDPHLRKMEEEAYLKGNLNLRDFEDKRKSKAIYNSISIKVGE